MYPPDSRQSYPPSAQGQYSQPPVYQPYAPYPPSGYASPPPKPGMSTQKIIIIVVVVLALVILVPLILSGILMVYLTSMEQSGGNVQSPVGMAIDDYSPSNNSTGTTWVIVITTGSRTTTGVNIQVIDMNTGATTVNRPLKGLSDPNAQYRDNNGNGKLDRSDTIWLSGQGGNILSGHRVRLAAGEMIIAGPVTLP